MILTPCPYTPMFQACTWYSAKGKVSAFTCIMRQPVPALASCANQCLRLHHAPASALACIMRPPVSHSLAHTLAWVMPPMILTPCPYDTNTLAWVMPPMFCMVSNILTRFPCLAARRCATMQTPKKQPPSPLVYQPLICA